mgnify:CR=1 FL=1
MSQKKCRWGILGTAGIAQKNWQSIRNAGNAELVAVGSRDVAKAQDFIDRCSAQVPHPVPPKAVGSYDEMLASDEIDAIYLPLPTGLRAQWAIKVAQAGKHLLCEKPCGTTLDELDDILAACKEAGVQFMDGVMFMHPKPTGFISVSPIFLFFISTFPLKTCLYKKSFFILVLN